MSNHNTHPGQDHLRRYIREQGLAERMIPAVGTLYRERDVIITVFGRKLMNSSTIDIIKAHRLSSQVVKAETGLDQTSQVFEAQQRLNPGSSRIDIGKLVQAALTAGLALDNAPQLERWLGEQLAGIPDAITMLQTPRDVVLYGFGRILARLMIERTTLANPIRQ